MPPPGPSRRPLFQEDDGRPVRFFLRPGPAKVALAPLILREGGRLCPFQEPGAVLLAAPEDEAAAAGAAGAARAGGGFVSTAYVADCVARGQRLPLEPYRLPAASPPAPAPGLALLAAAADGRVRFSEADDRALLQAVAGASAASVSGTALWKLLAQARVTGHPWQAMRHRYLHHLCPRSLQEKKEPPQEGKGKGKRPAPGLQNKKVMDATQGEDHRQTEEDCIFQLANKEFEDSEEDGENGGLAENALSQHKELKTSEGATASPHPPTKRVSCEDSPRPHQPGPTTLGPSAAEVALAVEDMKHFMEEFGLDLEAVAQAFLKTSGEVAAVACYLRTGQHSDGCPLWSRQDDMDLLKGDKDLRSGLVARYGAENVDKREVFRRS